MITPLRVMTRSFYHLWKIKSFTGFISFCNHVFSFHGTMPAIDFSIETVLVVSSTDALYLDGAELPSVFEKWTDNIPLLWFLSGRSVGRHKRIYGKFEQTRPPCIDSNTDRANSIAFTDSGFSCSHGNWLNYLVNAPYHSMVNISKLSYFWITQ